MSSKIKNLKIKQYAAGFALATISLITSYTFNSQEYETNYYIYDFYNFDDHKIPFAKSSAGNVYFGNKADLLYIKDNIDDKAILIQDMTYRKDKNYKVLDSCKINDRNVMQEIVEIIKIYDEKKITSWERSTESMMLEWNAHNICSKLKIRNDHADDVDFNNNDEKIYNSKILKFLFKK